MQDSNLKYMTRKSRATVVVQAEPLGFVVKAPDETAFYQVVAMIKDLLEHIAPGSEDTLEIA